MVSQGRAAPSPPSSTATSAGSSSGTNTKSQTEFFDVFCIYEKIKGHAPVAGKVENRCRELRLLCDAEGKTRTVLRIPKTANDESEACGKIGREPWKAVGGLPLHAARVMPTVRSAQ